MHRLPPYFSMTKDNTSTIMHLVPRPPFPPPPPEFCITIAFNSPGYYSRPQKSRKQWLYKVSFFWRRGGLGGVGKQGALWSM